MLWNEAKSSASDNSFTPRFLFLLSQVNTMSSPKPVGAELSRHALRKRLQATHTLKFFQNIV
jgi:hypothetical protein